MDATPTPTAGWSDESQVAWYLGRIGRLEARQAGEQVLIDVLPERPVRMLDLGCGDGRLTALALEHRSSLVEVVAVDISPPMLNRARQRFRGDGRVHVEVHDLGESIANLGNFDLIVSGFAIHHLEHC